MFVFVLPALFLVVTVVHGFVVTVIQHPTKSRESQCVSPNPFHLSLVPETKSYFDSPIDDETYLEECMLFLDGNWDECHKHLPLSDLVSSCTSILEDRYSLAASPDIIPTLEEGQRLICMGDVHGDLEALKECLQLSGLIDNTNEATSNGNSNTTGNEETVVWTGGNTVLVQTGDILDRGYSELDCFSLLSKLSRQAKEEGGHVILLYGNHEGK